MALKKKGKVEPVREDPPSRMVNAPASVTVQGGLTVTTSILGPAEIWKSKDDWVQKEADSVKIWSDMEFSDREIVMSIVDAALDRLKDRLADWVPQSLTGQGGEYVDVSFRILFAEIEKERRAADIQMKMDVDKAKVEVTEIVKELSDDLSR